MPEIKLFELGPTRSSRVRWTLLEAGLPWESVGNDIEVFKSDALREVHPLGKLPAAVIDGKPLFESAAIVTAIADLVPEKSLIAPPGSWSRYLHYQWVSFALTEMEAFLQSSEINSIDFILPKEQHVPDIIEQNTRLFRKGAAALENALTQSDYLVDDRFSATDIFVGYTVSWADEDGLLRDFPNLRSYLDRLLAREHCPLQHNAESSNPE
ncbi:MAG: glutathione S-transferase family protein [Pseudomonadota bacterium]